MQYSWFYYRFNLLSVIWTGNDNIDRFITQTNSNITSSLRSIKWAEVDGIISVIFVRRRHIDDSFGLVRCYLVLSSVISHTFGYSLRWRRKPWQGLLMRLFDWLTTTLTNMLFDPVFQCAWQILRSYCWEFFPKNIAISSCFNGSAVHYDIGIFRNCNGNRNR